MHILKFFYRIEIGVIGAISRTDTTSYLISKAHRIDGPDCKLWIHIHPKDLKPFFFNTRWAHVISIPRFVANTSHILNDHLHNMPHTITSNNSLLSQFQVQVIDENSLMSFPNFFQTLTLLYCFFIDNKCAFLQICDRYANLSLCPAQCCICLSYKFEGFIDLYCNLRIRIWSWPKFGFVWDRKLKEVQIWNSEIKMSRILHPQ